MSLTTDIATLVARYEALAAAFDGKEASINAAVAAALLAIPSSSRRVYIDAINGNDANDGLTTATAVQTLLRAFALGATVRSLDVVLLSDITLTQARYGLAVGQAVRMYSQGYTEGTKRKINLTVQPASSPTLGDWEVSKLYCPAYGFNTLNIEGCEIVFPAAPASGVMAADEYNGLLSANQINGPAMTGIEISSGIITRPAGSVGVIAGIRTHFLSLMVKGTTYTSANLAGKWVAGVASGTAPTSIGWVASNLSTL